MNKSLLYIMETMSSYQEITITCFNRKSLSTLFSLQLVPIELKIKNYIHFLINAASTEYALQSTVLESPIFHSISALLI